MMRLMGLMVAAGLLGIAAIGSAQAEQKATGDGHVAHTRLAPVMMHRAFPPYTGVHVYSRGGGNSNGGRQGRGR